MSTCLNRSKYCIIFFLLLSFQSKGQNVELFNHISNEVITIPSKVLNQERQIYIHVPKKDSANPNKTFPVLYLLDGENHFHILSAYIDYLSHYEIIPPIMVVGIISKDRRKDLTPTKSIIDYDGKIDSTYKTSGGNEHFFQFMQTELMPYIEKNYKIDPYKIFAGHSFGGITTINCMLTHPDMFNAYVAISPSLWWDNKYILKLAENKLTKSMSLNKSFFYSVGNEGIKDPDSFHTDLLKFDSLIVNRTPKGLLYKYKCYPEESHMSEPIIAYYDALRFIYQDWIPPVKK
ncbi:MAG TPA: alpha/beta hydrolase-fold protein [Cyclobacteriaceae bacterium]|nr:alpha/beta hydrolase-fold protein [Cyclobacteriaceae bacterium]